MIKTSLSLLSLLWVALAVSVPDSKIMKMWCNFQLVWSNSDIATVNSIVHPRDIPATLYAANCQGYGPYVSQLEYYGTGHDSLSFEQPDDIAIVQTDSYVHWEGRQIENQFNTIQAKVWITLDSNAGSATFGDLAGNATMVASWIEPDGWRRLCCYRDSSRIIHYGVGNTGYNCRSAYWCNPQIGGHC